MNVVVILTQTILTGTEKCLLPIVLPLNSLEPCGSYLGVRQRCSCCRLTRIWYRFRRRIACLQPDRSDDGLCPWPRLWVLSEPVFFIWAYGWRPLQSQGSAALRSGSGRWRSRCVRGAVFDRLRQGRFDLQGGLAFNGYGEHSPDGYSHTAAQICEFVMAFFVLMIILGATDERAPSGFAPIAIGLALTLIQARNGPVRFGSAWFDLI